MALIWLITTAHAQDIEEIEVTAPADTEDGPRGSSAVTVIHTRDLLGSADVAEAVDQAPGAVVRRLGGLGAWSAVSIRGSTARQVEVFLDGIPLNPDGGSVVNLSEWPLRAFERVEVYRGSAPVDLGTGAIGGVVHLVTGAPSAEVSATAGSFATARTTALASPGGARSDGLLVVDALHTRGDFTYFDDAGTTFTEEDDRFRTRQRNGTRQVSGHARWRYHDGPIRFTLLDGILLRDEEVPGYTWDPATEASYGVQRTLPAAQLEVARGAWTSTALLYGQWRRERYQDLASEIGIGAQDRTDVSSQGGLRLSAGFAPDARTTASLGASLRRDAVQGVDRLSVDRVDETRWVGQLHAAGSWWPSTRWNLGPALRMLSVSGDAPSWSLDPRLGLRGELGAITTQANVGRALRPPDLTELYGDRGALIGNPELRPERASVADLGATLRQGPWVLQLVGFGTWSTDHIVYIQNAQQVAVPVNLDRTRVLGLELATEFVRPPVAIQLTATRTWSTNLSEEPAYATKQLPRVPGWDFSQRTSIAHPLGTLGATTDWIDANYLDATNWYRSASRVFVGAFVTLVQGPATVELEALNLLDNIVERTPADPLVTASPDVPRAITDFVGYPLPGRTILLTVRLRDRT